VADAAVTQIVDLHAEVKAGYEKRLQVVKWRRQVLPILPESKKLAPLRHANLNFQSYLGLDRWSRR
jgi:hypothetical protein